MYVSKMLATNAYSLSSTSSPLSTQSNSENDSPSPSVPPCALAMDIGLNENDVVSSSDLNSLENLDCLANLENSENVEPVVSSLTDEMIELDEIAGIGDVEEMKEIQELVEKTSMLTDEQEAEANRKLAEAIPLPRNSSEGL